MRCSIFLIAGIALVSAQPDSKFFMVEHIYTQ